MSKERAVRQAKRLFTRAALSQCGWDEAMEALARAVDSHCGQLIGFGIRADVHFNVLTGIDPSMLDDFVRVGGGDPEINSRIRVGLRIPEMVWCGDSRLTPEQDTARSPEFAHWLARNRLGRCRLLKLVRRDDMNVGTCIGRDSGQGDFTAEDDRILEDLAPALRNAVLIQQAIEGEQAAIVANSFDRVSRPIFVCGPDGQIVACSRRAERLLTERRWFTARGNRLRAAHPGLAGMFAALLARACLSAGGGGWSDGNAGDNAIILRDAEGEPLLVRMHGFADANPFRLLSAALVVPYVVENREAELAGLAARLFDLTPSEATILAYLASGRKPAAIAGLVGVQPSTVRSHLKRIFLKTGARSQLEVSAMLRNL